MDICVIKREGNIHHPKGYNIELILWKQSVFSRTKNLFIGTKGGGNCNNL